MTKLSEDYIQSMADAALGHFMEDGNLIRLEDALTTLDALNKSSALGTAKMLHGVNGNWGIADAGDQDFMGWAKRYSNKSEEVIKRRILVWEVLSGDHIPEEFKDSIKGQTMRQLEKIPAVVVSASKNDDGTFGFEKEEYEVDWIGLSEAKDEQATAEVIAEIKNRPRSKNYMRLEMTGRNVYARRGEIQELIFTFERNYDDEKLFEKAKSKIIDLCGIKTGE